MIVAGSLEYAHARLWARNGERADEAAWRSVEIVRDFTAALDAARRLPAFRDWVATIAPDATAHDVEAILRMRWRALVAEVARWMPAEWQPAVRWCAILIDVPVFQYLARGGPPLAWISRDALYRGFIEDEGAARDGPLAPLARTDDIAAAWQREWRRVLPNRYQDTALPALERVLREHRETVSDATADGTPMRRALQSRLRAQFRKALGDPAAAFIFLALCALDLERLRGELVRRAAFLRLALAA